MEILELCECVHMFDEDRCMLTWAIWRPSSGSGAKNKHTPRRYEQTYKLQRENEV